MVPGWKGGKALPFGGSFGEYSLNDFEEQPDRENGTDSPELLWSFPGGLLDCIGRAGLLESLPWLPDGGRLEKGDYPTDHLSPLQNLAPFLFN